MSRGVGDREGTFQWLTASTHIPLDNPVNVVYVKRHWHHEYLTMCFTEIICLLYLANMPFVQEILRAVVVICGEMEVKIYLG